MRKAFLRMDPKIQVYFMSNPDLVGNGEGLHCEKRNTFFVLIFGYVWGCV